MVLDSNDTSEEQQLITWLNSVLEPSPATTQLLCDEAQLESKLQLNHQSLLNDCLSMKRKLEGNITWARFVVASKGQQEWMQNADRLLTCYRQCWLKVAHQVLILLDESKRKAHLKTESTKQNNAKNALLQYLVSSSSSEPKNWVHVASVRLLLVIYFLDQVKKETSPLLEYQPSLFVVNEKTKAQQMTFKAITSSEQVLSQFILTSLSAGLGAQFRTQLRAIAYTLHHNECEVEFAFTFAINSTLLSPSHLSDGIRFAKLAEILFPAPCNGLLKLLKYPAKSLADRTANMLRLMSTFLWSRLQQYDGKTWQTVDMQQTAIEVANCHNRESTIRLLQSLRHIQQQIKLQQYYRPHLSKIMAMQRRVKDKVETARCRREFLRLRGATIKVQRQFRAQVAARKARSSYLQLKMAVIIVQKRFRLKQNMSALLAYVDGLLVRFQKAAVTIQRHWRGVSTRWRTEKLLREEAISANCNFELMGLIASIELHAAFPCGLSIGDKMEAIFVRLKSAASKVHSELNIGTPMLKKTSFLQKLDNDLHTLQQYTEVSQEIRARILVNEQEQSKWSLLTFLGTLLQHLNRSEEHKEIARTSLSLLHCLLMPIRMKSIAVNIQVAVPSVTWNLMGETLLHLMHNYINYPVLLKTAMAIFRRLVEQEKEKNSTLGTSTGSLLLTGENRLWVRLLERIKEKYRIDGLYDHSDSCDVVAGANCSCSQVKCEFLQMMNIMEFTDSL